MNIIEAIKSGKKCKRRLWKKKWIDPKDRGHYINLTFDDLDANDWEVEQVPVTVTEDSFAAAWKRAVKKAGGDDITYAGFKPFRDLVAKELGL
jgi:hypothetical protein